MPRGHRCIVIAFVGWLSLAAGPNQSAESKQFPPQTNRTQAAPAIANDTQTVDPVQPREYYRPCQQDRHDGRSDLCAQWTAAQAAKEAAYWTKWGFWLSLAGLGGLITSLYYTRKAVLAADSATQDADMAIEIAGRNAEAAARLASISEEHGELRLRAYITVTDIKFLTDRPGELWAEVTIQNKGVTAALEMQSDFGLTVLEGNSSDGSALGYAPHGAKHILAAGEPLVLKSGADVLPRQPDEILAGDWTLVIVGIASYKDVFGKPHDTKFRYHWRGRFRANGRAIEPTEIGNEMT